MMIIASVVGITLLVIDFPMVWEHMLVLRVVWWVRSSISKSKIFSLGVLVQSGGED